MCVASVNRRRPLLGAALPQFSSVFRFDGDVGLATLQEAVAQDPAVTVDRARSMDKKSPVRRAKRQAKGPEDNFWDCSVCTYRNTAEAFKCLMCDVRKGTSTRKPRINSQLVAQQVATQFLPAAAAAAAATAAAATSNHHGSGSEGSRGQGAQAGANPKRERNKDKKALKKRRHPPRLKNVDRSTAQTREVTVNSVTVIITEYKPKVKSAETVTSSSSSDHGSQSESSMDAR